MNNKARSVTSKKTMSLTKSAALAGTVGSLSLARSVHAKGSTVFKIGLVGAGGRGTGAAIQALNACPNGKLVAVADAFGDRLDNSLRAITSKHKDRVDVPNDRKFTDLLGYQNVLQSDIDMVLLCTPPGFRPMMFEAAVDAGKQIFMEKPLAVDGPGIRRILAANEKAKKKGLLVAVGHHLRHEVKHREVIRRLHDGIIGDILYMRAYFNSSGVWVRPRKPDQTEMQYQVRNWYYFNWVCGDHIVEQHVHDLDIINWIKQAHPIKARGMGGRQVRKGPEYGEIFDHHSVEFEYADGSRLFSCCRHMPGTWGSFSEHAHGTKGYASMQGHGIGEIFVDGKEKMKWERGPDGHQLEHNDLFAALKAGKPYNEVGYSADSTMTAILGRMATYSGKTVTWEDGINSTLDLSPSSYAWDATPSVLPQKDGTYACAIPGVTKAW